MTDHKDLPLPCGVNYKSCIAAIFWIGFAVAIVGALAAVLIVQDAAASPLLDGVYTPQQVHELAQSHVFGIPHPRHDIRERGDGHVDGFPAHVNGLLSDKSSYLPGLPPVVPPYKLPVRPDEYTPLVIECGAPGGVCESREDGR